MATVPTYIFVPNTIIYSAEVNTNFDNVYNYINDDHHSDADGTKVAWTTGLNFTSSNLTSIATRNHDNLQNIQGGTTAQYYHLTSAQHTAVIGTLFSVAGESGTPQAISLSDTLTIAAGTGINTVAGATDTVTINLDDMALTPGSYGSASSVAAITVDQQGRLTAVSNINIAISSTAITGTLFNIDSDESAPDAITRGDMLTIAGGANITTTTEANQITVNLDSMIEIIGLRIKQTVDATKYIELLHDGTDGTISTAGSSGGGDLVFDCAGNNYWFELSGTIFLQIQDDGTSVMLSSINNITLDPGTNVYTKHIIPRTTGTYTLGDATVNEFLHAYVATYHSGLETGQTAAGATIITQLQYSGGTLQAKNRTIAITGGIITTYSAESDWINV